jgi:hypothetical protein
MTLQMYVETHSVTHVGLLNAQDKGTTIIQNNFSNEN